MGQLRPDTDSELLARLAAAGYTATICGSEVYVNEDISDLDGWPLFWSVLRDARRSCGGGNRFSHQITPEPEP